MICKHCGRSFEGTFCPNCGMRAEQNVCPVCGAPHAEGDAFCANCGNAFTATAPMSATAPSAPSSATDLQEGARRTPRAQRRKQREEHERAVYAQVSSEITALPEGYKMPKPMQEGTSDFTGSGVVNFFMRLALIFGTLFSLGLAYPPLKCWQARWETKHTFMNGRRLTFDGKAYMLYGNFIKWLLLSIVTLTIYAWIWMKFNVRRWVTRHTHVLGVVGQKSEFTGTAFGYWWCNTANSFLCVITLFLGWFWTKCRKRRWFARHTFIDGCAVEFDGRAVQYFGKCIVWLLLTVVTLGVYSVWLLVKTKKWTARHTVFRRADMFPLPEAQAISVLRADETERRIKAENKAGGGIYGRAIGLAGAFNFAGFVMFFVGLVAFLASIDYANISQENIFVASTVVPFSDALLAGGILCFIGFGLAVTGLVLNVRRKQKNLRRLGGWAMALNGVMLLFAPLFTVMLMYVGGSVVVTAILTSYGAICAVWFVYSAMAVAARRRAKMRCKGKVAGLIVSAILLIYLIVLSIILFTPSY